MVKRSILIGSLSGPNFAANMDRLRTYFTEIVFVERYSKGNILYVGSFSFLSDQKVCRTSVEMT